MTVPTIPVVFYRENDGTAAVLAHGLVKERVVPSREIELTLTRKRRFEQDPERHTYEGV
ncbi:MAG TPA: hypothetical protein VGA17_12425 [Nitrospiraceae bacterium]